MFGVGTLTEREEQKFEIKKMRTVRATKHDGAVGYESEQL